MPLNSAQLGELVNRARHKAPPIISPPPLAPTAHRPARTRQATPAPQLPSNGQPSSSRGKPPSGEPVITTTLAVALHAAEVDDFPIGWELRKESWHFHRRFYAIFKRAMRHGEYSQLLCQIRRGAAEHLSENCWRVTLPGSSRTLPVRATSWRLVTILPKNWQPPVPSPFGEYKA